MIYLVLILITILFFLMGVIFSWAESGTRFMMALSRLPYSKKSIAPQVFYTLSIIMGLYTVIYFVYHHVKLV